ncbi:MAG: hypothetical protein HY795_11640 [Desulfovibrio sp.]|nr:hypothetical protein [Desulfovibrio sp.]MBI4958962.1 hypothetical protein [Desulfovibrio sp.]
MYYFDSLSTVEWLVVYGRMSEAAQAWTSLSAQVEVLCDLIHQALDLAGINREDCAAKALLTQLDGGPAFAPLDGEFEQTSLPSPPPTVLLKNLALARSKIEIVFLTFKRHFYHLMGTSQDDYAHRRGAWKCRIFLHILAGMLIIAMAIVGGSYFNTRLKANFIIRPLNLLAPGSPDTVRVGGLNPMETGGAGPFAWAEGPRLLIAFSIGSPAPVRLTFRFGNPIAHQTIMVRANGEECRSYRDIPVTPHGVTSVEGSLEMNAKAGLNTLEFDFEKYNGFENLFAPGDPRPLAAPFFELTIVRVP